MGHHVFSCRSLLLSTTVLNDSFILVNIPLQYRCNNCIASCCNYHKEHIQYRPTLGNNCIVSMLQ